jgi:Zn-dependent peptidase ImmA (M78 family)
MHHPWRELRDRRPDWQVLYTTLPDDLKGYTDAEHHTIWIDRRLDQAARRATLAHEAIHAARQDVDCSAKDEAEIEQEAARIMLPLDRLLHVLPWAHNLYEAAEELWVDEPMLQVRLDHLHPSERAAIRRAFAARDNTEES